MERVSRRSLLTTASAGVAVAGVAAVAGPAASAVAAPAPKAAPAAPKATPLTDHVVARVKDLRTGEVDLFVGERQVTVRDPALANAIAHAAQQHTA